MCLWLCPSFLKLRETGVICPSFRPDALCSYILFLSAFRVSCGNEFVNRDGFVTTTLWFRGDIVSRHGITEVSLTSSC